MKARLILNYILFFIFTCLVFVFILFPSDQVASGLNRHLTDPDSELACHVDAVQLYPLNRIKLKNTLLIIDSKNKIQPEDVVLSLNLSSIFKANKTFKLTSRLNDGMVNGSLSLSHINPVKILSIDLSFSQINLDQGEYKTTLADIQIGGILKGTYIFSNQTNTPTGSGTMDIEPVFINLKDSLFKQINIPRVEFKTVHLEYRHVARQITIENLSARGPMINIKLNGKIDTASLIGDSPLHLEGRILSDSPYLANFLNLRSFRSKAAAIGQKGIRFTITGTLTSPTLKI